MASKGVNKVILVGNLGKDPEIRYLPSGGAVANFSIATSEEWEDKQTGEQKSKVEWHNISIFGKLAEIAGEYLRKGSQVYVEGQLQTRKWQDQSGNDRYTTEVVLQGFNGVMQMLGGKSNDNPSPKPNQQQGGFQQQQTQQPQRNQYNQAQQGGFQQQPQQQGGFQRQAPVQHPQQAKAPDLDEGWDSDIPF